MPIDVLRWITEKRPNYVLVPLALSLSALAVAQPSPNLLRSYSGSGGLGWAVADLPDLDGDGKRDFVAGANVNGQVVVYSSARSAPLWSVTTGIASFGWSVSNAGDIDGDGVSDVIAGAPNSPGGGAALVMSGVDGELILNLARPAGAGRFGYAVSHLDDINADGARELLVGASGNAQLYVLSGADGSVLRTHVGSAGSEFGAGVAVVADIDGDNVSDYVVGAPVDGNGRAYVYSGASGAELFRLDPLSNGRFGDFFVADAGDVDADGITDLYVGAYAENNNNGAAYVFSGATGSRLFRIAGSLAEGLGPGRGAGDVDGDGHADLVVGSYSYSAGGVSQGGRVTVYSGADRSVLMRVNGTRSSGQLGFDAVGLGDVDSDGRLDFIVASSPVSTVDLYSGVVNQILYADGFEDLGLP